MLLVQSGIWTYRLWQCLEKKATMWNAGTVCRKIQRAGNGQNSTNCTKRKCIAETSGVNTVSITLLRTHKARTQEKTRVWNVSGDPAEIIEEWMQFRPDLKKLDKDIEIQNRGSGNGLTALLIKTRKFRRQSAIQNIPSFRLFRQKEVWRK